MPVDNYVVLYIPDQTNEIVTVNRVMYAGSQMEAHDYKWTDDDM